MDSFEEYKELFLRIIADLMAKMDNMVSHMDTLSSMRD